VPAPPAPIKTEVLVGVMAASINVDDVPLLQNTGAGG
jgi:NADPH:quinone reductase-like Zn-dependent oxidoreductase